MTIHNHDSQSNLDCEARQLALMDRIIGLEAELANIKIGEPHRLRHDIEALRGSATWKAGRIVLAPVRFGRRVLRMVGKR